MTDQFTVKGNIVDIFNKRIFRGTVYVEKGKIKQIDETGAVSDDLNYIMPGFIDAHVHIESSMLVPSEFAKISVCHGTVATVSDPHEIANVMGLEGIRYMLNNGSRVPFKFYFGAPSCVPATKFETAGAVINPSDIEELFRQDNLKYLSEMMNYPGVLNNDPEILQKLNIAKKYNKPIDGHAPGLRGEDLKKYIGAGISTDHECFLLDEALDKISNGMKIIIREGSAAKNFETLHPLLGSHPEMVMFCSDDKHPNDLIEGQIDRIVSRAVNKGYNVYDVLRASSINPVIHYKLDVGLLREGDCADFIIVNNLSDFRVLQTYINGLLVSENGRSNIRYQEKDLLNNFTAAYRKPDDFRVSINDDKKASINVIEARDGQLITGRLNLHCKVNNSEIVSDTENDILKLAVAERYGRNHLSVAFIRGFGLKRGAIASSVAHDSHNIIAVGVTDEDISNAVNAVIESKGGISASSGGLTEILPLPVAGIMTTSDAYKTSEEYIRLDGLAKEFGSALQAPFMTLSFMALLVIPELKLSDLGLFDGRKFCLINLQLNDDFDKS
jgi:adenine deaminase